MSSYRDQMGRRVELPGIPRRIISLVPSQTELLFDLGLDKEVVGITKFCVHPEHWRRDKAIIGGTKRAHFDRIEDLAPDLIIGNKEENTEDMIRHLEQYYPVWMSDIYNLADALNMIRSLGAILGKAKKAEALSGEIRHAFAGLEQAAYPPLRVAYFIWREPYMVVARNTFIDHLLSRAGFVNVFSDRTRYPTVDLSELTALAPDLILLSSEPFPFREKHVAEFQAVAPQSRIRVVDGEMFSWYGSRLRLVPGYIAKLREHL